MSSTSSSPTKRSADSPYRRNPLELEFDTFERTYFAADVAVQGEDIIYHFWPPGEDLDFAPQFARHLEDGFKKILPSTAEVHAEFMDRREAAALVRFAGDVDKDATPRPTYYVRVVGWANNPMADAYLKGKVFAEIEKAVKEFLDDRNSESQQHA